MYLNITSSNLVHCSLGNSIFCKESCIALIILNDLSSTLCAGKRLNASLTSSFSCNTSSWCNPALKIWLICKIVEIIIINIIYNYCKHLNTYQIYWNQKDYMPSDEQPLRKRKICIISKYYNTWRGIIIHYIPLEANAFIIGMLDNNK